MIDLVSLMPEGLFVVLSILWGVCAGFSGACFFSKPMIAGQFMDIPNKRGSHSIPTPKGGGFGILMAVMVAAIVLDMPLSMLFPVFTVSILGLLSDRFDIAPAVRLIVHLCAALIVVVFYDPISTRFYDPISIYFHDPLSNCFHDPISNYFHGLISVHATTASWQSISPSHFLPRFSHLFCLYAAFWTLFIAASANFYNFMDGINGIAALSAVLCFLLIALFRVQYAYMDSFTILCLVTAGAALGFLPMNFPQAKVFMGDVGSIFLGFLFAAMMLAHCPSVNEFLVYFSFLFPFYCDELTTMSVRVKAGDNLFKAHRKHLYQILVNERGISHLKVTIFYAMVQTVIGLIMIFLYSFAQTAILLMMLLLFFVMFSLFSCCLRRGKRFFFWNYR